MDSEKDIELLIIPIFIRVRTVSEVKLITSEIVLSLVVNLERP